ncbi:MAG: hypothetical protein A3F82_04180 [Deltaproteobacteria bacterium RIFCSPLOWO2_12_FULL_44_12]|nr:MAG: hypothetical protein A2712_08280 [Deltaproteobacteria bacterium RIFCSPHIGHO2_01_FULL_43_49]OGQ14665.1 MAG: hypothetical protein A3D22_08720 [Deltaproteobacteria bacterium RIFCSPHIGHO2_02_FULL_44_53]OGQ28051.1 MAG: hypothetical protein A3D98_07430 [Deltaproteobacteria bacterium RIFCSPHIGHO2_12_FULL_44_21]OGQ31263.1 MAG: hypothetical protein A2979_07480 [Deltaproteobacteria bacterium RIFCSPLOWO2_01_FULL_45_74]OGQ43255.1 MAG: hypothetical protein A3I70_01140 [Deltaproteobacteria bacterium 
MPGCQIFDAKVVKMKKWLLLGFCIVLLASCTHKRAQITAGQPSGGFGPPTPTASGDIPEPPPPTPPEVLNCPTDGTYTVINPYKQGVEKYVGPLDSQRLNDFQPHIQPRNAGGKIADFQVYREANQFYLLTGYGKTLVTKSYDMTASQSQIDNSPVLDETLLDAAIQQVIAFPYQNKTWLVAATHLSLNFFESQAGDITNTKGQIPFPSSIISLFYDAANQELYVADAEGDVFRLAMSSAERGGCIDRVVSKEEFLERTIQKIQVAKDKLYVLSEKGVDSSVVNLENMAALPNLVADIFGGFAEGFMKETLRLMYVLTDPTHLRLDSIDLSKGERKTLRTDSMSGATHVRAQINDFFVNQDKIYVVAGRLFTESENQELLSGVSSYLMSLCGRPDQLCSKSMPLLWLSMPNLPQELNRIAETLLGRSPAFSSLSRYHAKPAGLVVFNNNNLATPSTIYLLQDTQNTGEPFQKGLWDVQGVNKSGDIYLASSRVVLHLTPQGSNNFAQSLLHYEDLPGTFSDFVSFIQSARQTYKIDYLSNNGQTAVLRLRGFTINRALENVLVSANPVVKSEHKSRGLPRNIVGRKKSDIFTSIDWVDYAHKWIAKWNGAQATDLGSPFESFPYKISSWDPISGSTTVAYLDNKQNTDPIDDVYVTKIIDPQGQEVLAQPQDVIAPALPALLELPYAPSCTMKIQRGLKGVTSIGPPRTTKTSYFYLSYVKSTFTGTGCPNNLPPPTTHAIMNSFSKSSMGWSINDSLDLGEVSTVVGGGGFAGPLRRESSGDLYFLVKIPALVMVKYGVKHDPAGNPISEEEFLGRSFLVFDEAMKNIIVAKGESDSLVLADKGSSSFARFYRFPWSDLIQRADLDEPNTQNPPGPLALDVAHELGYSLQLDILDNDVASILQLGNNNVLLNIVGKLGTSRLELLKIDASNQFQRLLSGRFQRLMDMAYDEEDHRNIVLSLEDNGLEFYRLPLIP